MRIKYACLYHNHQIYIVKNTVAKLNDYFEMNEKKVELGFLFQLDKSQARRSHEVSFAYFFT
jgi:hypothetical protein